MSSFLTIHTLLYKTGEKQLKFVSLLFIYKLLIVNYLAGKL